MKTVHTYCRICEPQCALLAQVDEEQQDIVKLMPDKSHPVHKGFACHKGLNFLELHKDPDRNNYPRKRTNAKTAMAPEFECIDWDTASREIAEKISEFSERHGSDALGMYTGNPSAFNSTGRDAAKSFARGVGVKYFFGSGTQDCSNKFAASEAVFGTANLHPIPDFKNTNYFLSLGSNPKISHVSFVHMTDPMKTLREIVARGGVIKHINPRKIESAGRSTGEVIQVKPDTDIYLLAALIDSIYQAGQHDQEWIDQHATNVDELWSFVAQYNADTVAEIVGLSAQSIRQLALEFAAAEGASVHMSTGVNMGRQGTLAYWLVQMLSLITGNLGRRGGNIYSPGYFPAATVGKPKKADPFFQSEFGEMRKIAGSLPGNLLADHIEAGLVKGLVVMSGNPILSMAGEARLKAAFSQLELLVVVDIYPNATSMFADYILPATDWLERPDMNALSLGFQPEPYVQVVEAVVEPKFERKPEWWIFASLQKELGMNSILDSTDENGDVVDPMSRLDRQLASSDLSLQQIIDQPNQTIRLPDPEPNLLFDIGVQLENQNVDCMPHLIKLGLDSVAQQFSQLQSAPDGLKLISLRTNYMVNSWMHNLPSLKREHVLDNPLHVNPEDLQRLGLQAGVEVSVKSDFGQVIAILKEDSDLRPGVVAMTHGWGHANNPNLGVASNHPGTNINAVLPTGQGSFDPLSNMSHMTGIAVELSIVA